MKPSIVFFGTDEVSVAVLDELKAAGFMPALIVTQPDRPQGRKLLLTPPAAKIWALENDVPIMQPEKLGKDFRMELSQKAASSGIADSQWDLFIVASYGKILGSRLLDMPKYKTLNVHPSLLPLFRGPTPVEGAMLADAKDTGVTIMRMDTEMDHGPILAQEKMHFDEWPDKPEVLNTLAHLGGKTLARIIPDWIAGKIAEQEQDHSRATFTQLLEKKDGELDVTALRNASHDEQRKAFLTYKAYKPWPGTFFFTGDPDDSERTRVKITDAAFEDGRFIIKKVIPEGKKEIDYSLF